MTTNLKAIYENGVLRLEEPLSLPNGAEVDVQVTAYDDGNGDRLCGEDRLFRSLCRRRHTFFEVSARAVCGQFYELFHRAVFNGSAVSAALVLREVSVVTCY